MVKQIMNRIEEKASVNFSLSFLIQLVSAIGLGVWAYSQLDGRISTVENATDTAVEDILRIEDNMSANQDKPISSDHIQNTKLYNLEQNVLQLRSQIKVLEERTYKHSLDHRNFAIDQEKD